MPTVNVNGIRMYWERAGSGQPLLFISGSGADLRNRPNQFDSHLGEHFDLICFDQRGLGQTDTPPGAFSMGDYADDAVGLLDALGIDRIDVVGVSFGGMVAQELVLRHPSRVGALALACTSAGGAGGASYPLHELAELPQRQRAEQHLRVADTRCTPAWIAEHPQRWNQLVDMALGRTSGGAEGARKQLAARRQHDTFERLGRVRHPVLLAAGRHDGIAPPRNMEAMHRVLANSTLRWFEGGHMFLIQDKTAYPSIVEWLRETR